MPKPDAALHPEQDHECPHCGAVVRAGRTFCRECGSDARTGWQDNEEIEYHATGLVTEETLPPSTPAPVSKRLVVVAIVVGLLGIVALVFGRYR